MYVYKFYNSACGGSARVGGGIEGFRGQPAVIDATSAGTYPSPRRSMTSAQAAHTCIHQTPPPLEAASIATALSRAFGIPQPTGRLSRVQIDLS